MRRTDMMMMRTLMIAALWCACAGALAPAAGDDECALYLTGPGRSSAFDYSLNLLRGNFGYEGQHACITYEAVNQAYLEARKRILVSQPKGDWKPEDYASVGELVLDISINLARRYGLTYEEIEKGLPLIDTSRTLIREVCPPVFSRVECRAGKYRRLDGLCNNLEHPTWGATNAPFQRLIGPLFADGINAPRIAHSGHELPLSRVVSRTMHPDEGFHDHAGTVMVIAWGQFMDHDYTLTGTPLDPISRNDPEECCKRPPHLKHPYCNEIRVPDDDYFYRLFGVKCIDFVRGFPSPRPGCRLGSRVPFNTLTGAIDGNTVYGVTEKFSRKLRTGYGGLLRMNPVFKEYGLKDLLPLKLDIPDEGCTRPNKNMYCFEAGEIRVNEQLVLTVMHTLMAREHNRVARALAAVNPHWDDETLFQEARRINIAEIQHITYNEFLPILLGKDVMEKFGLVVEKEGYWDGYDNTVNPDVIDSFASAAYRFGHSLLPTAVERWSKAHKFIASKRLSDLIRRPYDLYRAGVLDEYVMGLMNQVAQAMDDSITQEVTNHLFKKVGARFGMDLVSFNMQRGREFGIPGYMEFRKFCGLSGAETFQDLFGSMPNETVRKYESIFERPVDVDLWSGGVSERPLPGSMLGPTFACVIATQFSYSRRGDRFWYELPNQPSSFTPEQLREVRKARLARVICDNTDIIDTVQLYPMVLPDHELNPRVPCRSGIIPSMDFSKWAEPAPFAGAAKQFMTDALIEAKENVPQRNNTRNEDIDVPSQLQNTQNEKINNATAKLSSNVTKSIDKATNITCNDNADLETQNCTDKLNKNIDSDTGIEFVSGKNDEIKQKNSGHIRNSLNRKRSLRIQLDSTGSNSAPEILNYENISPKDRELAARLLQQNNRIKNSDLAHLQMTDALIAAKEDIPQQNNIVNKDINVPSQLQNTQNEKISNATAKVSSNATKSIDSAKNITCDDNADLKTQNCTDKLNKNTNTDTIMKFVSGKNDERKQKKSGHIRNSLGRKRSLRIQLDSTGSNSAPEILNYENIRSPKDRELASRLLQQNNHIKNSDLANFNIQTRHEYVKEPINDKEDAENYRQLPDKSSRSQENSSETIESDEHSGEHKVHGTENNSSESSETDSDESRESTPPLKKRLPVESHENIESHEKIVKSPPRVNSGEVRDSEENSEEKNDESGSIEQQDKNSRSDEVEGNSNEHESVPKQQYKEGRKNDYEDKDNETSSLKQLHLGDSNGKVPQTFHDVDLRDFSYERIEINDKGEVESAKDSPDNESSLEELPAKGIEVNDKRKVESAKDSSDNESSLEELPAKGNQTAENERPRSNEYIEKTNNDEIKPVVEINSESSNSNELSEEEVETTSAQKAELNSEDKSLETLLGVKEENSDKSNGQNEEEISGNVKEEFERIPLNYRHDKKSEQKNDGDRPAENNENSEVATDVPAGGTLETLLPEGERYDDKLNFKFDDGAIKLPEIKLPDDILTYNYESPYKKKGKTSKGKNRFYEYSDEHSVENPLIPQYDDDRGYSIEPKEDKQSYKQSNEDEDDEEEDLYEKFVRERFGKRGSFEKRSEQLRNEVFRPSNPGLSERIQRILKRSEETQKAAEKSGDPKAGYMWTLEYGANA